MLNLNDWTILAWMGGTGMAAVGGLVQGNRVRRRHSAVRARSLRCLEAEAYAGLEPALTPMESPRELAHRVCAAVAKHSAFQQAAMFMPDAESCLHLAGSSGVNELNALAVGGQVARFARERRKRVAAAEREFDLPAMLDIKECSTASDADLQQVIVLPMWSHMGELMGALAVWRRVSRYQNDQEAGKAPEKELLEPVLGLAAKLGRSLELNQMSARLLGSERLAMVSRVGRMRASLSARTDLRQA